MAHAGSPGKPSLNLDLESLHPNLRVSEPGIVNGIDQLRNLVAKSVATGARKATWLRAVRENPTWERAEQAPAQQTGASEPDRSFPAEMDSQFANPSPREARFLLRIPSPHYEFEILLSRLAFGIQIYIMGQHLFLLGQFFGPPRATQLPSGAVFQRLQCVFTSGSLEYMDILLPRCLFTPPGWL